jgi:hypothetical protein
MGYNTDFKGELRFVNELNSSSLGLINTFLGQDCRDHPEWGINDLTYINLEFLDDFSGLRWNGKSETYGMVDAVNLIVENMRKNYVERFRLCGELLAKGESSEDRWELLINSNGMAERCTLGTNEKIVANENNVTNISDKNNCSFSISPTRLLEEVLDELGDGKPLEGYSKVLVLLLDDNDGLYDIKSYAAGIKGSQRVSLLECAKSQLVTDMGY